MSVSTDTSPEAPLTTPCHGSTVADPHRFLSTRWAQNATIEGRSTYRCRASHTSIPCVHCLWWSPGPPSQTRSLLPSWTFWVLLLPWFEWQWSWIYCTSVVIHNDIQIFSPSGQHNRHGSRYADMDLFEILTHLSRSFLVRGVPISPWCTQCTHQDCEYSQASLYWPYHSCHSVLIPPS